MEKEIKPCPFCGDLMQIDLAGTLGHRGNPDCIIAFQSWHESRLPEWNRRTDLATNPNGMEL